MDGFTIMIADRNPHVREYLSREMLQAGYQVRLAKTGLEVLNTILHGESFDLLILDPDLPDGRHIKLLERLRNETPSIPVIIHTYDREYMIHPAPVGSGVIVEKSGSSIEALKTAVVDLLRPGQQPSKGFPYVPK